MAVRMQSILSKPKNRRYFGILIFLSCMYYVVLMINAHVRSLPMVKLTTLRKAPSIVKSLAPIYHETRWDTIQTRGKVDDQIHWSLVILTMNRPKSLQRLLDSLEAAEYDGDKVQLVIWIDYRNDTLHDETIKLVDSFKFSHGPKVIHERKVNAGLTRSWFDAWVPKSDEEYGVIFEDDVEASVYFYRWMKMAWAAYKDVPEFAAIALQRQKVRGTGGNHKIINDHKPFLYKLIGTNGFAPHPVHWKAFITWVRRAFYRIEPLVDGLMATGWWLHINKNENVFEQWFIYYCNQHTLFNLYITLQNTEALAVHYAEHGEHHPSHVAGGSWANLTTRWSEDLQTFPKKLVHYDWDAEPMACPPQCDCTAWQDVNVTVS